MHHKYDPFSKDIAASSFPRFEYLRREQPELLPQADVDLDAVIDVRRVGARASRARLVTLPATADAGLEVVAAFDPL